MHIADKGGDTVMGGGGERGASSIERPGSPLPGPHVRQAQDDSSASASDKRARQEQLSAIEGRRRASGRSLSAIADRLTVRTVGLSLLEGAAADSDTEPSTAQAAGSTWTVRGGLVVGGSVGCGRDLYCLLGDLDLERADSHDSVLRSIAECAAALERMAGEGAAGA